MNLLSFCPLEVLHSFMYCELISTVVILVINIPLSLSLDYHADFIKNEKLDIVI